MLPILYQLVKCCIQSRRPSQPPRLPKPTATTSGRIYTSATLELGPTPNPHRQHIPIHNISTHILRINRIHIPNKWSPKLNRIETQNIPSAIALARPSVSSRKVLEVSNVVPRAGKTETAV